MSNRNDERVLRYLIYAVVLSGTVAVVGMVALATLAPQSGWGWGGSMHAGGWGMMGVGMVFMTVPFLLLILVLWLLVTADGGTLSERQSKE